MGKQAEAQTRNQVRRRCSPTIPRDGVTMQDLVQVWESPTTVFKPEEMLCEHVVRATIQTEEGENTIQCNVMLQPLSSYIDFLALLKKAGLLPGYEFNFHYFKNVKSRWVPLTSFTETMPTKASVLVIIKKAPTKAETRKDPPPSRSHNSKKQAPLRKAIKKPTAIAA